MVIYKMDSLVALKDHSRQLSDRLACTRHWEISKTIMYLSVAVYLMCQISILLRRQQCSNDLLTELHHTTDRLHRVESSLEVLQKTVLQLKEKHDRTKRMVPVIKTGGWRRKKKKRRRSLRSFRREIRSLRKKMKVFEKRLQCVKTSNGTVRGRICGRKGETSRKPNTQPSGKKNQNEDNRVKPNDSSSKKKPSKRRAIFVRWGTSQCRTSNKSHTSLVYAGRVASPHFRDKGGGSNYLCMHDKALYTNPVDITDIDRAFLYPVKFGPVTKVFNKVSAKALRFLPPDKRKLLNYTLDYKDVPCAVCRVDGATTALMIPAHNVCPTSWNRQYHGYLMAQKHDSQKSEFICVDVDAKGIPNTENRNADSLLHLTEFKCGSSACGTYQSRKALACAVCTT